MREDMCKVIVERPRLRCGKKSIDSSDGRHFRDRVHDDEDGGFAPHRLGMKAGYGDRKGLNENLAPLGRWLEAQVNRPWDKVYSELCASIDRRNTVQAHIFTHLSNFVALDTSLVDGDVVAKERFWSRQYLPIGEMRQDLFVHPRTGILLLNRRRIQVKHKRAAANEIKRAQARSRRKELSEREQLLVVDGQWFAVTLAPLPEGVPTGKVDGQGKAEQAYERRWDVVLRKVVARESRGSDAGDALYGKRGWYAVSKRQLGAKEIKRHELEQKAGDSRLFFGGV